MPYITQGDRKFLDVDRLQVTADTPGELNYMVTKIALQFVEAHGKSYSTYNAVIGALECAKLEMYRRAVAPYEDTKIAENGDVY